MGVDRKIDAARDGGSTVAFIEAGPYVESCNVVQGDQVDGAGQSQLGRAAEGDGFRLEVGSGWGHKRFSFVKIGSSIIVRIGPVRKSGKEILPILEQIYCIFLRRKISFYERPFFPSFFTCTGGQNLL